MLFIFLNIMVHLAAPDSSCRRQLSANNNDRLSAPPELEPFYAQVSFHRAPAKGELNTVKVWIEAESLAEPAKLKFCSKI